MKPLPYFYILDPGYGKRKNRIYHNTLHNVHLFWVQHLRFHYTEFPVEFPFKLCVNKLLKWSYQTYTYINQYIWKEAMLFNRLNIFIYKWVPTSVVNYRI